MTCGCSRFEMRTFHSRPSTSAVFDRFDEPTYAVVVPLSRRNSHALACSRVVRVSYETLTSAPSSASRSSARWSVAPM